MKCRCEARRGDHCQLCMGQTCWNKTYEYEGEIYHLVDAVLLWSTGSYDGPMSGIAAYRGFACYAKCYTYYRDRSFWLYPLRAEEWKSEIIHRARWLQGELKSLDRSAYVRRKPLGFFRISYVNEPIGANVIGEEWRQKHYGHYFEEQ